MSRELKNLTIKDLRENIYLKQNGIESCKTQITEYIGDIERYKEEIILRKKGGV